MMYAVLPTRLREEIAVRRKVEGKMRTEADIFRDLEVLCTSEGYIHTISELSLRDNYVMFKGGVEPDDLSKMHGWDRLVRNEISTLIGLMVKGDVSSVILDQEHIALQVSETEQLLSELHEVLAAPMMTQFSDAALNQREPEMLGAGAVLREPIFYAAESAYSFQYRSLTNIKYENDNDWLKTSKGFGIESAVAVAASIGRIQDEKATMFNLANKMQEGKIASCLPVFSFTIDEIVEDGGVDAQTVASVLSAFCAGNMPTNENFSSVNEFNQAKACPVLMIKYVGFVLLQQYDLYEAIYESPYYWMLSDAEYIDIANQNRGTFTEQFLTARLIDVFGEDCVFSNVEIKDKRGNIEAEIDVLVVYKDRAIVVQAKSKRLTLLSRKGNDNSIKDDFRKAIQKAYDQAVSCIGKIANSQLRLFDGDGIEISVRRSFTEIVPICAISDHYPSLNFQVRQLLQINEQSGVGAPFVMDLFLLDALCEFLTRPIDVLYFLHKRIELHEKIISNNDLAILSYHLTQKLWVEDETSFVLFDDSISQELDAAFLVRRGGLEGRDTPEGFMKTIQEGFSSRFISQVLDRSEDFLIDLVYFLFDLSRVSFDEIFGAIERQTNLAVSDGAGHDFSTAFGSMGLTFHCTSVDLLTMHKRLLDHCKMRKEKCGSELWFGFARHATSTTSFQQVVVLSK